MQPKLQPRSRPKFAVKQWQLIVRHVQKAKPLKNTAKTKKTKKRKAAKVGICDYYQACQKLKAVSEYSIILENIKHLYSMNRQRGRHSHQTVRRMPGRIDGHWRKWQTLLLWFWQRLLLAQMSYCRYRRKFGKVK